MRSDFLRDFCNILRFFKRPEVGGFVRTLGVFTYVFLFTEAGKIEFEVDFFVALIESAKSDGAVGEGTNEDVDFRALYDTFGLFTQGVLVDGDDAFVFEDVEVLFLHVDDVVPEEQGRGHHAPQGEVGAVFFDGQFAVADFEHIGIVPVAGRGVGVERNVLFVQAHDALPRPLDVAGGTPQVRNGRTPHPRVAVTPAAEGIRDGLLRFARLLFHRLLGF